MSVICIKDLWKSYSHGSNVTDVLKGINLEIEEGSFVSILGRSGSGKTTLLNVISTLEPYNDGDIFINGYKINKLNTKDINTIRNNYIGFVFQEFNLVKDMTVLDNVATPLILNGVSFKEARKKAETALDKVGLGQYLKLRPPELSGGQQQRVAIARAIVNDQKIILCDEPTGALDDYTAKEILELLKGISKEKTVLMVTHDESYAKEYSDRIIMLVDGNIVKDTKNGQPLKEDDNKTTNKISSISIGFVNLFKYAFLSMNVDNKKLSKTFITFSISITLFIILSVINQNLDVFAEKYFSNLVKNEVADKSVILHFIYQFLEQNISYLIQLVLYVLITFCIVSYLFVFSINIINKKVEIAVLKALGASQETVALLFALRPIKFTFTIFKQTMVFTVASILIINNVFDLNKFLIADYLGFFVNIFKVIYGVFISLLFNFDSDFIKFHLHYSHIGFIFAIILSLFMIGSLLPAYKISRANTIRLLAKE